MMTTFAHLTRNFTFFETSRFAGVLANQLLMVVLAWQMYDITRSAMDLGLVGLFQFFPSLLLTLPAGQLADKIKRTHIIAVSMLVQAIAAFSMVLATQHDGLSRELILAVSVVIGIARAFQKPAQQALIPHLVERDALDKAMAINASGVQLAVVCGPALGGILYAMQPDCAYLIGGILMSISCFLLPFIRYQHYNRREKTSLRSLFAGFNFVWQNKLLLGAVSLDLFAVLFGGSTALLPIITRDVLHSGPESLGWLRASPAIGALLMTLLIMRYPLKKSAGGLLMLSVALFGAATIVFGISNSLTLSLLALIVAGATDTVSAVIRQTLVQTETPDEIRGRVSAVNSIFTGTSNQLGEFESGAVAAWIGAVDSVIWGGVGTIVVVFIWLFLFPALAKRDRLVA